MKLSDWLKKNDLTQADFAGQLGVTQARISQIARRGTNSLAIAERIEEKTKRGVTIQDLRMISQEAAG